MYQTMEMGSKIKTNTTERRDIMKEQKYTVKIETITPEIAKRLLESNEKNRKINPERVMKYANDMKRGMWSAATMLIVDEDGHLIDANHRLNAVIKADTPVQMVVFSGLEKKYLPFIDTGRPRSAGDMLAFMDGVEGVGGLKNASAIARNVLAYRTQNLSRTIYVGYDEIAKLIIDEKECMATAMKFYNAAHRRCAIGCGLSAGGGAAMFLIIQKNKDSIGDFNAFCNRVIYGENITKQSPEYAARCAILNNSHYTGQTRIVRDMYTILRAWEAHVKGESLQQVRIPKEAAANMPEVAVK